MPEPPLAPFRDAALRADPSMLRVDEPTTTSSYERVETVVSERGVPAHAEERTTFEERHPFSLGATFLGWSVAAFFTLVFTVVTVAFLGTRVAGSPIDLSGVALGALAGYLVATFAAYIIGGYAAGRIALWDGVKHGMLTVFWAVLFAAVAVALGTTLSAQFDMSAYIPVDFSTLTTGSIIAVVLTLVAMLAGSGLGGMIGERYHARVHGTDQPRRSSRMRGRPL